MFNFLMFCLAVIFYGIIRIILHDMRYSKYVLHVLIEFVKSFFCNLYSRKDEFIPLGSDQFNNSQVCLRMVYSLLLMSITFLEP